MHQYIFNIYFIMNNCICIEICLLFKWLNNLYYYIFMNLHFLISYTCHLSKILIVFFWVLINSPPFVNLFNLDLLLTIKVSLYWNLIFEAKFSYPNFIHFIRVIFYWRLNTVLYLYWILIPCFGPLLESELF